MLHHLHFYDITGVLLLQEHRQWQSRVIVRFEHVNGTAFKFYYIINIIMIIMSLVCKEKHSVKHFKFQTAARKIYNLKIYSIIVEPSGPHFWHFYFRCHSIPDKPKWLFFSFEWSDKDHIHSWIYLSNDSRMLNMDRKFVVSVSRVYDD